MEAVFLETKFFQEIMSFILNFHKKTFFQTL